MDIVRKLPDKYINIEVVDELKILIYTANSEFNLNGISEKEYPRINLEESKKKVFIKSDVFKDIVNQTVFASSNEESKPVLTGINFNIVGDILECNSTDSYRLARKVVKLSNSNEENYNIVIPSRNIMEFSRIIDDNEEDIELHIFNNKILFKNGNLKFESRLINGTYPNTSNLLPKEDQVKLHFNINDFYNVVDRVSILTSDKDKNIVTMEEGSLKGGAGSAVLEVLNENGMLQSVKVLNLGIPDKYIPHGAKPLLMRDIGLDHESVVKRIKEFLNNGD